MFNIQETENETTGNYMHVDVNPKMDDLMLQNEPSQESIGSTSALRRRNTITTKQPVRNKSSCKNTNGGKT